MKAEEGNKGSSKTKAAHGVFKTLKRFEKYYDPDNSAQRVEALFADETDTAQRIASLIPHMLYTFGLFIEGFSKSVVSMTDEERKAFLKTCINKIDGVTLGDSINAISQLLLSLTDEDVNGTTPELIGKRLGEAVSVIDYGKFREAVEQSGNNILKSLAEPIDIAMSNPVSLANIMLLIPTVLNIIIKGISDLIDSIDIPSEVVASAILNMSSEIDKKALGGLINAFSSKLCAFHEGHLILGEGPSYLENHLIGLFGETWREIDENILGEALKGMCEDMASIMKACAIFARQEPEVLAFAADAGISVINSVMEGLSMAFEELNRTGISSGSVEVKTGARPDGEAAARLINQSAALIAAHMERRSYEEGASFSRELISNIDTGVIKKLLSDISGLVSDATEGEPSDIALSTSHELQIVKYATSRLSPLIARIDSKKAEASAVAASEALYGAFEENPEQLDAIITPVFKTLVRLAGKWLRYRMSKLFQRIRNRS